MTQRSNPRTSEQLRAASEHFSYEVWMLEETAAALQTGAFAGTSAENALLESFTVHARALMHFFFPTDRIHRDDVLAADYFDDGTAWERLAGESPVDLGRVRSRVGTEIVHLSYGRLDVGPEAKGWDVGAIGAALIRLVELFRANVPADRIVGPWGTLTAMSPGVLSTQAPTTKFMTLVNTPSANSPFQMPRGRTGDNSR